MKITVFHTILALPIVYGFLLYFWRLSYYVQSYPILDGMELVHFILYSLLIAIPVMLVLFLIFEKLDEIVLYDTDKAKRG